METSQTSALKRKLPQVHDLRLKRRLGAERADHTAQGHVGRMVQQGFFICRLIGRAQRLVRFRRQIRHDDEFSDPGIGLGIGCRGAGMARRGLLVCRPHHEPPEIQRLLLPLFMQQILHVGGQYSETAQPHVRTVALNEPMGGHVVKMQRSRDLCRELPGNLRPALLHQFDESVQLRRHEERVDRIAEQDQIRRLERGLRLGKVILIKTDARPDVEHVERAVREELSDVIHCLKRDAVFSRRGAVQDQNLHVFLLMFDTDAGPAFRLRLRISSFLCKHDAGAPGQCLPAGTRDQRPSPGGPSCESAGRTARYAAESPDRRSFRPRP